ncbi:MAG: hypothetical protein ACK48G_10605 [Chitinophagaceae bacterium]|jgi:effector-binding domain-containing protein
MRKGMKLGIIGLVLAVGLLFLILPTTKEVIVRVPLPLERVMLEFEDTARLFRWYQPDTDPNMQVSVSKANPFEFILDHRQDGNSIPLHIVVSPDTTDSKVTKMVYRYASSLINDPGKDIKAYASVALEHLGDSLKRTEYVYGYKIVTTTVVDSSFLFLSKTVPASLEAEETKKIYDELIAYAEKRNAGYNGVRIFYRQVISKNETALFASIGVSNYTPTGPDEKIQYKMMPYGKKLLVMDYEGPYERAKGLFSILEQYKQDNALVSMAIPFIKYVSPGYGFTDSQVVKVRISYPVF